MKLSIAIKVDVHPARVQRWLGLEGQDLLDAIKAAADSGDEVEISIGLKKGVLTMPASTPPMFKGMDFEGRGSSDDR